MKKVVLGIICLALMGACLMGMAMADGMNVEEVYSLVDREEYQLHDNEYPGGWLGVAGHQFGISIEGGSGNYSYKSNKKGVAVVSSSGIITCKKYGTAFITVTDRNTGASCRFRMRVLKNDRYHNDPWRWARDADPGVYSTMRKAYLKGSTLYIEMYILNNSASPTGKTSASVKLYLAPTYNLDWEFPDDYKFMGNFNVKIPNIKPNKFAVIKFKVGQVDKTAIYLRNADAYCQGGIIIGDAYYHGGDNDYDDYAQSRAAKAKKIA